MRTRLHVFRRAASGAGGVHRLTLPASSERATSDEPSRREGPGTSCVPPPVCQHYACQSSVPTRIAWHRCAGRPPRECGSPVPPTPSAASALKHDHFAVVHWGFPSVNPPRSPIDTHMANLECNAVSAVQITHHFLAQLIAAGRTGCFVYTSSASAVLPSPFSVLYAGTKAFLSMFAASLAPEVKPYGIDVLAVHPSPVASR